MQNETNFPGKYLFNNASKANIPRGRQLVIHLIVLLLLIRLLLHAAPYLACLSTGSSPYCGRTVLHHKWNQKKENCARGTFQIKSLLLLDDVNSSRSYVLAQLKVASNSTERPLLAQVPVLNKHFIRINLAVVLAWLQHDDSLRGWWWYIVGN